jgi:hypothetical protein
VTAPFRLAARKLTRQSAVQPWNIVQRAIFFDSNRSASQALDVTGGRGCTLPGKRRQIPQTTRFNRV